MKFSKVSQLALVSILGLVAATLLSGCMIVTIDYVFVACSSGSSAGSAGQIQTFAADAHSGALRVVNNRCRPGSTSPRHGRARQLRPPLRGQPEQQVGGSLHHRLRRNARPERHRYRPVHSHRAGH